MTEAEWLACTDPTPMWPLLSEKLTARKSRLFCVACCRRVWDVLQEMQGTLEYDNLHDALETAEYYADGLLASLPEPVLVKTDKHGHRYSDGCLNAQEAVWWTCSRPDFMVRIAVGCCQLARTGPDEAVAQVVILRDIFGNPFHQVTLNLAWQTSNVVSLATAIYQDRAFDRMPILADALEEAGCTNADILQHCRQPGEHLRGCWVVDLLLGRE
jgi:hypothetical protein